jgi:hypothetical protein
MGVRVAHSCRPDYIICVVSRYCGGRNRLFQLAVLNIITGSFFDGYFIAWESGGDVKPSGPFTGMCEQIADDMRAFLFSTYTSWAGMVGFAAVMAHDQQEASSVARCRSFVHDCAGGVCYVPHGVHWRDLISCRYRYQRVYECLPFEGDSEIAHVSLIDVLDVDDDRKEMTAGVECSIGGAFTGNLVGNLVDCYFKRVAGVPRGTPSSATHYLLC